MTQRIAWEDSYATGISIIDKQHMQLVDTLNVLVDAIDSESRHGQIYDIILQLKDYAKYHFSTEEKLMQEYNYPAYDEHRMEHVTFVDQITLFDLDTILATDGLVWEVLHFLRQWLTTHILVVDKQFAASVLTMQEASA